MKDVTLYFTQPEAENIVALRIFEGPSADGPWTLIERTENIGGYPEYVTQYTTSAATSNTDYFALAWEDANGDVGDMTAGEQGQIDTSSILATPNDINSHLSPTTVRATPGNTALIQISVARIINAYLSRIVDRTVLATWTTPTETPDIIREIAGMLIASQLYINETSNSTTEITDTHFAQRLYNTAISMLNQVIAGTIPIPDITETPVEGLTSLDFFPVDSTDRAFTMGMNL